MNCKQGHFTVYGFIYAYAIHNNLYYIEIEDYFTSNSTNFISLLRKFVASLFSLQLNLQNFQLHTLSSRLESIYIEAAWWIGDREKNVNLFCKFGKRRDRSSKLWT